MSVLRLLNEARNRQSNQILYHTQLFLLSTSKLLSIITMTTILDHLLQLHDFLLSSPGYGNVAPETRLGKYLCMLYTFFGIPLNVTFMRLLGLQFRSCLQNILSLSKTIVGGDAWAFSVVLGGVVYFAFFEGLLIFVPAAVFNAIEDWSYLQAVYYCFVSLSTIGLGDYVAGK